MNRSTNRENSLNTMEKNFKLRLELVVIRIVYRINGSKSVSTGRTLETLETLAS